VINDVTAALDHGRHCLVLTQWTAHLERLTDELRQREHDPVILRGGMSTKIRRLALARLQEPTDSAPLLVVATASDDHSRPRNPHGAQVRVLHRVFEPNTLAQTRP
jgi:hypothetical protein